MSAPRGNLDVVDGRNLEKVIVIPLGSEQYEYEITRFMITQVRVAADS